MTRPLSQAKREIFLRYLAERGHVVAACRAAKIARSSAYRTRKLDPAFAQAWEEAERSAADLLEAEAWRRAVDGIEDPVFYQGEQVAAVRRYSDRMLDRLLRARRPERFADNYRPSGDSDTGVNVRRLSREQLMAVAAAGLKPPKG